jgi:polysaccharide export outer membrane protein
MNMSNRYTSALLAVAGTILLAFSVGQASAVEGDKVASTRLPGAEDAATVSESQAAPQRLKVDDYQIGPHDLLSITVFQVPDLAREVRVNSRGIISLPLIGAVQAAGLTSDQLEDSIAKKLSQNYLQDPQVSVFIKEYISQRVTVEGSVQKAGIYQLTGATTLLQAIAMASGVDQLADESNVKIFRQNGNGKRETLVYDLEKIRAGTIQDPYIKGDDVVVVEKSGARSTIKSVTDTIRGFLWFH